MAGLLSMGAGLGITGNYWRHATSNFTDFDPSKPTEVTLDSYVAGDTAYLDMRTQDVKERFVELIANKLHQDKRFRLGESELALAQSTINQYEFLEETRKSNGLYAAVFRHKETGEIVLTFGGTSTVSAAPIINNIDDMFISTAGGKVSQLDDALAFTDHVREQYGRIHHVSGYSIGGYLALYAAGTGKCGEAQCYTFDSPGVTRAMINNCCSISGDSRHKVTDRFQRQCTSVSVCRNTYNTLGQQPGEYFTFDNELCNWSIVPKDHRYPMFAQGMAKGKTLQYGINDDHSNGPWVCSAALMALTGVGLMLAIKKERQTSPKRLTGLEAMVPTPPERPYPRGTAR